MLTQVSYGIYLKGRLIRSAMVGTISEDAAEALEAQPQRDYPGCDVSVGEV